MFVDERQELIKQMLQEKQRVSVKDLSIYFNCSEDLIRKDLATIEKSGLCKRVYGGAILNRKDLHKNLVQDRIFENKTAKELIARKAYALLENGDTIYLDVSTTNIILASMINNGNKEITIVTSMFDIIKNIKNWQYKVIFIGGEVVESGDSCNGIITTEQIRRYNFDKAFFGTVGINIKADSVQTYNVNDGLTKHLAMKQSKQNYLLFEKEKLALAGNYNYAKLSEFD